MSATGHHRCCCSSTPDPCVDGCAACNDTYVVTWSYGGDTPSFPYARSEADPCIWDGAFLDSLTLDCTNHVWILHVTYGPYSTTWTAPTAGNPCPPSDGGTWTRTAGDPMTLVSVVGT